MFRIQVKSFITKITSSRAKYVQYCTNNYQTYYMLGGTIKHFSEGIGELFYCLQS